MASFSKRERTVMANYGYNAPRDRSEMIFGQGNPGVADLRYGAYPMSYNGCELVALHNATLLSGQKSSLAELARFMSERGYMWSPLGFSGVFGTRPGGIPAYLRFRDIPFKRCRRPRPEPGDIFILTYFSGRLHIHTVTLRFTGCQWQVWNLRARAAGCSEAASLRDIAPRYKWLSLYRLGGSLAKRSVL